MTAPEVCPRCGSAQVAEIVYGLVDFGSESLRRALESGKVVLGGCCVSKLDRQCRGCGARWESGTREWEEPEDEESGAEDGE